MATLNDLAGGFLQRMGDFATTVWRGVRNTQTHSLSSVTQPANVEPLTILSKDVLTLTETPDVLQALLSLFTGYYLRAASIMGSIDAVRVIRTLDKLNPDRRFNDLYIVSESSSSYLYRHKESFKYRLPTSYNTPALESEIRRVKFALERDISDKINIVDPYSDEDIEASLNRADTTSTAGRDNLAILTKNSNLAVGKTVQVTMQIGEEREITIPVTIRLATTSLPQESLVHLLTNKSDDITLTERWYAWRSERIEFIKDLIFCQDLIDAHKKAIIKDKDNVYQEILNRVKRGKGFGFLSDNPSLAVASNLIVITEEDQRIIEKNLGGKLSSPRVRDRIFNTTYAMIITIIDRDWGRAIFYTRDISQPTTVDLKSIKNSSDSKGNEIIDIIKSLQRGEAPSF